MATRPTSRQLQGHFNTLRARKSLTSAQTIDIASGRYGTGTEYAGADNVSHPDWVGATGIFYVYLDINGNLVLNDIEGFPFLSIKIATITIDSGIIVDIFDERPSINGPMDAYYIALENPGTFCSIEGDTVQDAIEELDAYVCTLVLTAALSERRTEYVDLDIDGGIPNGLVRKSHVNDTAALAFVNRNNKIGKVRYSVSIPGNYVRDTNINVKVFWSTPNDDDGYVSWRLKYKSLKSGTDSVDSAATTVTYDQNTPGIANKLVDTSDNLYVPFYDFDSSNLLVINIERENGIDDTYDSTVNVHRIRVEYVGLGVQDEEE